MLLVTGQSADDWREADEAEKAAWEASPPEIPDPDDPATALFIREWIEAGQVIQPDGRVASYSGFNRETGYFTLNGFDDITMSEAALIKQAGRIRYIGANLFYLGKGLRTNLPPSVRGGGLGFGNYLQCAAICDGDMEVLNLAATAYDRFTLGSLSFGDAGAPRLRKIIGHLSVRQLSRITGAPNLVDAEFVEPGASLDISTMPKLSAGTVRSLGYYPNRSSVTVHPDVYAKLTGDTTNDAVAALSAEELAQWAEVLEHCTSRLITFTRPA